MLIGPSHPRRASARRSGSTPTRSSRPRRSRRPPRRTVIEPRQPSTTPSRWVRANCEPRSDELRSRPLARSRHANVTVPAAAKLSLWVERSPAGLPPSTAPIAELSLRCAYRIGAALGLFAERVARPLRPCVTGPRASEQRPRELRAATHQFASGRSRNRSAPDRTPARDRGRSRPRSARAASRSRRFEWATCGLRSCMSALCAAVVAGLLGCRAHAESLGGSQGAGDPKLLGRISWRCRE
jgi:hypothetical protein